MHQNYMRVCAKVETAQSYPQDAFCPIKDTVFPESGGSLFPGHGFSEVYFKSDSFN